MSQTHEYERETVLSCPWCHEKVEIVESTKLSLFEASHHETTEVVGGSEQSQASPEIPFPVEGMSFNLTRVANHLFKSPGTEPSQRDLERAEWYIRQEIFRRQRKLSI